MSERAHVAAEIGAVVSEQLEGATRIEIVASRPQDLFDLQPGDTVPGSCAGFPVRFEAAFEPGIVAVRFWRHGVPVDQNLRISGDQVERA